MKESRKPEPTAFVTDTQSVKTSGNVPLTSQETDAAEKIGGRKHGTLTDAIGLTLAVTVTAVGLSGNALGIRLPHQAKEKYQALSKNWVDTGFKNAVAEHGIRLGIDVVNRNPDNRGFHVVKRPWVVERSIGWIMMHHRLARDYETHTVTSEAMIHIASIDNLADGVFVHGGLKARARGDVALRPQQSVLELAALQRPGRRRVHQAGRFLPLGTEASVAQLGGEPAGGPDVHELPAGTARARLGAQQLGVLARAARNLLRGAGALAGAGLVAWHDVFSPGTPRLPAVVRVV